MESLVGKVVAITFLDHTNGPLPILFTVYGRVERESKISITVQSWAYADAGEYALEVEDSNIGRYAIVRSTIQSIEILKARKAK